MYLRRTRSGSRDYLQLVESFRVDGGVRQRVLYSFGRLDQLDADQVKTLIDGLVRHTGVVLPSALPAPSVPVIESARAFGDTFVLDHLWRKLGLQSALRGALGSRRIRHEPLIRAMVLHRLCDPGSKLGTLRWLEDAVIPGVQTPSHAALLRAMDALEDSADALESCVLKALRPLLDQQLSVVFYDLTTIRAEGQSELTDDLRAFGHSKDRDLPARQVVVGVVQSACGLPLLHTVHKGNIAETATLLTMVRTLKAKLPIKRLVLVADRGLMSSDNLAALKACDGAVDFIMAVPAKRYRVLAPAIAALAFAADETGIKTLPIAEATEVAADLRQHRLIVSRNAERAAYERTTRDALIAELCQWADAQAEKLEAQDAGTPAQGTRLTDAKVYHQIRTRIENKRLSRIMRVELNDGLFSYEIDPQALERAQTFDGVLVIATSLSESDMAAERVVERYRALADIETGFQVLKNEIEMAPMFHRLPTRIRAHGAICFLALVLNRYLRQQLKRHGREESPRRLLDQLRQIRLCAVRQGPQRSQSLTEIPPEQQALLTQLSLPLPSPPVPT